MPSLSDRIVKEQGGVPDGMEPVHPTPPNAPLAPTQRPPLPILEPVVNSGFARCPIPPIYAQNPDNLRNWFNGGRVPQIRIYPQQLKGNS